MYKKQLVFQKIICILAIIAGAIVFVYSLGIMTDLYESLYPFIIDKTDLDNTKVAGARIVYDMQDFNNQLLICGVILIVVSLTLFITNTQSRRRYYIGNFISIGLCAVTNIVASIWALVNVFSYKNTYLTTVDFEELFKRAQNSKRYTYSDSTFWFDISTVVFGIVLVVTILLILNLVWKIMLMKTEQRLIDESNNAEVQ